MSLQNQVAIVRLTEKSQIDMVIRLCDQAFPDPISMRETYPDLLEKIHAYGLFFAAKTEETVGYAAMYSNDIAGQTAFMTLMAVKPECQGMGVGQMLMAQCFSVAKENGMVRVRLEVRKNNPRAIALYERYGFSADGSQTDTSIFMIKNLSDDKEEDRS